MQKQQTERCVICGREVTLEEWNNPEFVCDKCHQKYYAKKETKLNDNEAIEGVADIGRWLDDKGY